MTEADVVKKLIGRINPIGETGTDNERFENLKSLCRLIDGLITDIDDMAYQYKDYKEHTMKRQCDYANEFLTKIKMR